MSSTLFPFTKEQLIPQPEMLELKKQKGELFIGLPKETHFEEKRISLTPDAVSALLAHGHKVVVESGAGEGANYSDSEYANSGAKISHSTKEVFESDVILKVEPPSLDEIKCLRPQAILISALQLKTQKRKYFEALAKKKATAIAFDYIRDELGVYPIAKSLSEIAGIATMHIAAEIMTNANGGNGLLMGNIGGVPPSDVVVIGAGTVGEFATKSAVGLGARVKVFDNSLSRLRKLQHCIQFPIYTSTIQPKTLAKALMRCDLAIGALRGEKRSPVVVTKTMVEQMKDGAVIVDVSIDRGGCFETSKVTTHSNPTFKYCDVVHYCVPNIPSRYARTASISISNIFTPYLLEIAEQGGFENAAKYNKSLRNGMYFYHGILTSKIVADWFNLEHRDINLLFL
ncbi:MAG: alanine dehydrogenase [Tenacibaculum sp.]